MLSKEDNERLTRVGPGTPMGTLMREYWLPAIRSAKIVAGDKPERVRLLGEDFVAFRSPDGTPGFINEACPHRLASMALARNEDGGLRCIFHGWKVSNEGALVDTPTEPAERRELFCKHAPQHRYPVREAGGMVWVYLGKKDSLPPFPEFEFNTLPAENVEPLRGIMKCNWLQALEAALDSAHVGFLHARDGGMRGTTKTFAETGYMAVNKAPRFEFDLQPYGFKEGALRDLPEDSYYARIRQVILPFYSLIPRLPDEPRLALISVPIDDYNTIQWYVRYDPDAALDPEYFALFGTDCGDPDYFNADMGDVSNMWHQDRQAMANGHWSGIVGRVNAYEDFVVQESMGALVDRSREHLGASDVIITLARRQLLKAVKEHEETGAAPFVTDEQGEIDYGALRSLSIKVPSETSWKALDPFNPPVAEAAE